MDRNCPNAANPYHKCGTHCLEKIAQDKGTKGRKNLGGKTSKKEMGRAANPSCPKASNPYHECDENCLKRNTDANSGGFRRESGTKLLDASRSFGRKKKGSDSQPISPTGHFASKNLEVNNGQQSEEIDSQDRSLDNGVVQSTGMLGVTAPPGLADNIESVAAPHNNSVTQTPKVEEKVHALPEKLASDPSVEDEKVVVSSPAFSLSAGGNGTKEGSDDEEFESVISDSRVSVGKYHVKARVSTVLQSIFENYGDIAANCHLESTSMRAYYLECLCEVVQELESTPFKQLTKSKIKEMFSVLKDVESAGIDVNWLRGILDEISEAVEHVGQNQSMTGARATYHRALESTRKEAESQMEDLSSKEKEAADARERVAVIKARLSQLELEHSRWDKMITSVVGNKTG